MPKVRKTQSRPTTKKTEESLREYHQTPTSTKAKVIPQFGNSTTEECEDSESQKIITCSTTTSPYFFTKNESLKLGNSFFDVPCQDLAKKLLGKIIGRKLPTGEILKAMIVETECYLGEIDKASHSFEGKRTERNAAMYMKPGTAYVYIIYGMYHCFNISSGGNGACVLIRALEPLEGLEVIQKFRNERRTTPKILKKKELCNGPSKLCQGFKIEKMLFNQVDLTECEFMWLEQHRDINDQEIISCKRIGIDGYGPEWADKPLRFYIYENEYVSLKNKNAEKVYCTNILA